MKYKKYPRFKSILRRGNNSIGEMQPQLPLPEEEEAEDAGVDDETGVAEKRSSFQFSLLVVFLIISGGLIFFATFSSISSITTKSLLQKRDQVFSMVSSTADISTISATLPTTDQETAAMEQKPKTVPPPTIGSDDSIINNASEFPLRKIPDVEWVQRVDNYRYKIRRKGTNTTVMQTIPKSMVILRPGGYYNGTDGGGGANLLWCENAKAGTTTMYYRILKEVDLTMTRADWTRLCKEPEIRKYQKSLSAPKFTRCADRPPNRCYFPTCPMMARNFFEDDNDHLFTIDRNHQPDRQNDVMNAPSFTIIRNPWDRIRSAYEGKIRTKKLKPRHWNPPPPPPPPPPKNNDGIANNNNNDNDGYMSFVEFVSYVEQYPNDNPHWIPHSTECGIRSFRYDYVVRLENGLVEQIKEIFQWHSMPFPLTLDEKTLDLSDEAKSRNNQKLRQYYVDAVAEAAGKGSGGSFSSNFAAENTNITVEKLVEQVYNIYRDDADIYGYSFPWNNTFD